MRLIACLLWLGLAPAAAAAVLQHDLDVALDPTSHRLTVTDRLTLPDGAPRTLTFDLHAGFQPRVVGEGELDRIGGGREPIPFERYRLRLPPQQREVVVRYGGELHHPPVRYGQGVGQEAAASPGTIGPEGVFLGPASGWYPLFENAGHHRFSLTVTVPEGWQAVSQGAREETPQGVRWHEPQPQDAIYLIANRYHTYRSDGPVAEAMVYLHRPDEALAQRYLAATHEYLQLYSALMGEYPYAKFALVENFWETGYGMPSFTLLGSRVIRLPFILHTSYPHEIAHNWWGNGVYVDFERGNWSEGLTAYMADHLLKERDGLGAEYRRDQLRKFAEYVSAARDFPLVEFTGRHSGATQAVGYGKTAMFFHMLRREVGDEVFLQALRRFYREQRFTEAGFDDIRRAFEAESEHRLGPFFEQWLTRPGAPELRLANAELRAGAVVLHLAQRQSAPPFRLRVPVAVGLADGRVVERSVEMHGRQLTAEVPVDGRPVCVAVDPGFDLFRRLLPGELPVSLDSLFGAERLLLVVPSRAPDALATAYRELARRWATGASVEVVGDADLKALPGNRPVFLLGWNNKFRGAFTDALGARATIGDGVSIGEKRWPSAQHGFVMTAERRDAPIGWLAAADPAAITALARKVPHYGKYGYLVFAGPEAVNQVKGEWPAAASPLVQRVGGATCLPEPGPSLAAAADSERR